MLTHEETWTSLRRANPVPDAGRLLTDAEFNARFAAVYARRGDMTSLQFETQRSSKPEPSPEPPPPRRLRPWYRRPAMVFLVTVAAALVLAVPLMLFTGDGSDVTQTPAPTAPAPVVTTTLSPPTTSTTTLSPTTIPAEPPVIATPFALQGWQVVTPIPDTRGAFERVVATEFGFVAISSTSGSGIWTSLDGVEWTQLWDEWDPVGLGVAFGISDLAVNGDRIAAVVNNSRDGSAGIARSTDAENWTYTVLSEGGDDPPWPLSIVGYGTDGFIVTGSDSGSGAAVWLSTDGEEYQLVYEGSGPESGGSFRTGASDGQTAVLGMEFAELLVTRDGETWEPIPRLAAVDGEGQACSYLSLGALAHGPAGFVAVGDCGPYGTAWISPDGFTWSQIPYDDAAFGEPAWLTSIAASERGYVAGGNSGPDGEVRAPTVWTSPDGVGWTRVVLEVSVIEDAGVLGVAISENTFAAVGWVDDQAAIWRAVLTD